MAILVAVGWASYRVLVLPAPDESVTFDRGDNAVWLRRQWLYESPSTESIEKLAAGLRERGIRRIYPFLGPMDSDGHPGWRDKGKLHRYEPETARRFIEQMKSVAPEVRVLPWTGGNLGEDVRLGDRGRLEGFATQMRVLTQDLGAAGVHLNIEPMPSATPGFLDFLRRVKQAIGPAKTLSVAGYPPPHLLHPFPSVHWKTSFITDVCREVDEIAVMAYDTAQWFDPAFTYLVARWTHQVMEAAGEARREGGLGCEILIGVPSYEDDTVYHRPDVETLVNGLKGVRAGLASYRGQAPEWFRGVSVYAGWTTDDSEWRSYARLWQGRGAASGFAQPAIDEKEAPK